MEKIFKNIQKLLGIESSRTKNIFRHVLWSFLYKGGSLIAAFLMIPLCIRFLDNENYGIWLTISSFIAWFSFFDIGLGNGLRNKFAESIARDDTDDAIGYVSTAYFTISAICLLFMIITISISFLVNWNTVFNAEQIGPELNYLMAVVFGCFGLQLILKLITSIYTADQNHSIQGKVNFYISTGSLFLIWLLTQTANSSLLLFGIVFSVLPVLILLTLNIVAFSKRYAQYRPVLSRWNRKQFKDIFGLGLSFFIIQVSVVIMFATDNMIITQLFGPEAVVPYNLAYKYMGIPSMVLIIIVTPYWSSITEAYVKGDIAWIKRSMKNLMKIVGTAVTLILLLGIISPFAYELWVGDLVHIPWKLTVWTGIFFVVSVLYAPFNFFLNGVGKIKIQTWVLAVGAILNVPLSIMLVKIFEIGVEGVIIATGICVLPMLLFMPQQYLRVISGKAKGIWNR